MSSKDISRAVNEIEPTPTLNCEMLRNGIPRLLAGIVLTLRLPHAWAQTQDERSPLDYDPNAPLFTFENEVPAARAGSFRVSPSATLATGYDSNVLATDRDRSADSISVAQGLVKFTNASTVLQPDGTPADKWDMTGLGFVRARRFIDTAEADTNEFGLGLNFDGRPSSQDQVFGQVAAQRLFESRTEIETPHSLPVSYYNEYRANLAEEHTFSRLTARATVGAVRQDFTDFTQDYRNRWSYMGELRGAYELHSDLSLLAIGYYNRDDFTVPSALIDSATTVGGLVGTHYEIPEVLDLEFSGGPFKRRFAGGRGELTGISVRGTLTWQATRLMTIRTQVNREDQATRVAGVLGKVRTIVALQADHTYSPRVSLYGRARVIFDDYDIINRTDITYIAEAGVNVLVTRNYVLSFSYDYGSRSSYAVDNRFQRHVAGLSLTRRF
ncbi:MAG: hypothetical protein QOI59_6291 [Gammaproteobacteria bacterium]|nr:hypothetical protein [Gammaproteobacteria bacterium]